MLTENEIQLLRDLGTVIGDSGSIAVAAHTGRYFVCSIAGIIFGLILFCLSAWLFSKRNQYDEDYVYLIICIFGFGLVFVFSNISGVFYPESYAIKELIETIKK